MPPTKTNVSSHAVLCLLVMGLTGCGKTYSLPSPDPAASLGGECVLIAGVPALDDPITVSLTHSLHASHVPVATNDAERMVFRHLYETLVRVDCRGDVEPGLARSWKRSDEGRVWRFDLRPNARFADGSHLVAEDVRVAWTDAKKRGVGTSWTLVDPDSIRTTGEDELTIALKEPVGEEPLIFAAPDLAVFRPGSYGAWPAGSGPYVPVTYPHREPGLVCVPNQYHPPSTRGRSALRFRVRTGVDPRDLLARDTDVILVEEKTDVDYVANLPGYAVVELAWNRTYFLLLPLAYDGSCDPPWLMKIKDELARDVMTSDSRVAAPDCPSVEHASRHYVDENPISFMAGLPEDLDKCRVVYQSEDANGERLASRLVGLIDAAPRGSPEKSLVLLGYDSRPVSAGLAGAPFQIALDGGRERAYVVANWPGSPDPCSSYESVRASVRWLSAPQSQFGCAIPLVDSRSHVAAKKGLAGIRMDWDGTVLLDHAGWEEDRTP